MTSSLLDLLTPEPLLHRLSKTISTSVLTDVFRFSLG